jgi:hypothetical protein
MDKHSSLLYGGGVSDGEKTFFVVTLFSASLVSLAEIGGNRKIIFCFFKFSPF